MLNTETNLTAVYGMIEALNGVSTGASNAKTSLLETFVDDRSFSFVFKNAYNHLKTTGISDRTVEKVEELAEDGGNRGERECLTDDEVKKVAMCQDRTLTGAALLGFLSACRSELTVDAYDVLTRMLIGDMRCGITATALNKLRPGYVPSFKVQLAHKFEEKRLKTFPVAVEAKYDGVRCIALLEKGGVKLFSRTGKLLKGDFPHLVEQLNALAQTAKSVYGDEAIVLDGEIMDEVSGFSETVAAVHRKTKNTNVSLFLFDIMPASEFESVTCDLPYHVRRAALKRIIAETAFGDNPSVQLSEEYLCHSVEEIFNINASILDKGGEGVIVKPMNGKYEFKRSFHWMKVKAKNTLDLAITGWEKGTGRIDGMLGAFVVDHSGVSVNVGSGLTDYLRGYFKGNEESCIGQMIEVEFHEETPDGSLRHPRFKAFRTGELATNPKSIEDGAGC